MSFGVRFRHSKGTLGPRVFLNLALVLSILCEFDGLLAAFALFAEGAVCSFVHGGLLFAWGWLGCQPAERAFVDSGVRERH